MSTREEVARIIYRAMYIGHNVPRWEDAPSWRRHRAYVAAGLAMAKMRDASAHQEARP